MPGTEKMKHVSLTLQVENDLKHQLSIGALKPGARLITKNLAEQLGMSITPVREALLRLVSVNALSVAPAQAFTVPGNDSNLLIVFYVQIMPDDFVMQLHRF